MIFEKKIELMVQTANSNFNILDNQMVKNIMPLVKEELNQISKTSSVGWAWDQPEEIYPSQMYSMTLWPIICRVVVKYLDCVDGWFKGVCI